MTQINDDELKRLVKAVEFSYGFSLLFAVCNSPSYRKRLIQSIKNLTSKPIVEIELEKNEPFDPCEQISIKLREAPKNCVVFVYGLEKLVPSESDEFGVKILLAMNWRRRCFQELDCPMVFWIPEYLERLIATKAPDFWDWRSGVFRFQIPKEFELETLSALAGMDVSNLTLSEKKEQIDMFESLYAEYSKGEESASKLALADVALSLGELYFSLGRYNDAEKMFQKALRLARELHRRDIEARTLNNLGILSFEQGRYGDAMRYFENALKIAKELGKKAEVATTLGNLGNLAAQQGRYDEAKGYFEKSLRIEEELGDRSGVALTLGNLGNLAAQQGRYDEAKGYYEKSLRIREELGDRAGVATTLNNLGNLAFVQGRYGEAKGYYEKSLSISEELGDRSGIATTLNNLGNLADDLNEPELAFRFTAIALSLFVSMGHANAQKAGVNLVLYARKLGYDEKKLEAELNKIVQEFEQRGFELVDELLRELDGAIDARKG